MPPRRLLVLLAAFAASSRIDAAEPSTYTVKPVPFRLESRLEGTFEPPKLTDVRADMKRWTQLVVEEAVPHGTRVGRGDVLIRLDTQKIDEAIRDLEIGGRLAATALSLLEREVAVLEKAAPLQLEVAARSRRMVQEDVERYDTKEAGLAAVANDKQLAAAEFALANAEEELGQLEKMYDQDDLTEETEEIVLKRARFEAEMAAFQAAMVRDRHERVAGLDLPRRMEFLHNLDRASELDFELAEESLPLALEKQRLDLEKARNEQRKAAENLAELRAERERMPIRAPADGIVYYGRWRQGKWLDADTVAGRLRPGGQIDARDTIMTVIGPGKLTLRAVVPEKELARVTAGYPARVVPRAFPDVRLGARVRGVSPVPVSSGKFDALLDLAEEHPRISAGMEADVRVIVESRPDALAVPRKAVFSEPLDDDARFVYVAVRDGREPQKRTVAVGRANDEAIEITAGLAFGEEILLEKPGAAEPGKVDPKQRKDDSPKEDAKPTDDLKPKEELKPEKTTTPPPGAARE
ncbi:MAG: HlyD family efflux transporter periplasmic adaptor subunit [Planctomycetia bacterium]|nr:HlyD family efflux transporter periplasmic adaptor subunit [Planctomycetia bacterium]